MCPSASWDINASPRWGRSAVGEQILEPAWHILPNQCFKISCASANWLHFNLRMFPFAVKLEQQGPAVRHVVRIYVSEQKSHIRLALLSALRSPVATYLYSAHRSRSIITFNTEVGTILCFFSLNAPCLLLLSCALASRLLVDKYQLLWQRRPCTFPQWAHGPLDESHPSLLWDDLSALTTTNLHPDLTTRLWRGCLHEHPHTPANHDLMPLIYTVSRAYQKVSSGALKQLHKGLAGTPDGTLCIWKRLEFWNTNTTFCKWYKFLIASLSSCVVFSITAISHFGELSYCVVVSQRIRQERTMRSWMRLMDKWNMCWDDSIDEEWCLYGRWGVTGKKNIVEYRYSHECSSQIFKQHLTRNCFHRGCGLNQRRSHLTQFAAIFHRRRHKTIV